MRLTLTKGKGRDILSEYLCEITSELDELAGFHKEETILHHYIILDELSESEKCLPIRVYGGTTGGITLDENNIITKIEIDTNYVVKTYDNEVNEKMKKYIGEKLEY